MYVIFISVISVILLTSVAFNANAGNVYSYTYTLNGQTVTSVSSSEPEPPLDSLSTIPTIENTDIEPSNESVDSTTGTNDDQSDPIENTVEDTAETDIVTNNIPVASHDSSGTEMNTAVNIDILANDKELIDLPIDVSILSHPENGQINVEPDNTITYIPNNGFLGTDSLLYEITDIDGDKSIASISIEVICNDCPEVLITLSWDPNPDDILGYAVYYGPTEDSANQLASVLPITSGQYNPAAPSIQYALVDDLYVMLNQDDTICFRLKAYNGTGFSEFSKSACL